MDDKMEGGCSQPPAARCPHVYNQQCQCPTPLPALSGGQVGKPATEQATLPLLPRGVSMQGKFCPSKLQCSNERC